MNEPMLPAVLEQILDMDLLAWYHVMLAVWCPTMTCLNVVSIVLVPWKAEGRA